MNAIYTIIIIAILALGGWFFLGDSFTAQEGEEMTDGEHMMEDGTIMEGEDHDAMMEDGDGDAMMEGDSMEGNEVSFDVSGSNFAFDVTEIRVKEGDTVTINFEAAEGFHDWVVDEFDAATDQVRPGTPTSVTFVADQSGTFEYYCSVGSHREMGMVGTLIVE